MSLLCVFYTCLEVRRTVLNPAKGFFNLDVGLDIWLLQHSPSGIWPDSVVVETPRNGNSRLP